jgi:hypothetical protein
MAAEPAHLPNAAGYSGNPKRGGVWWMCTLIATLFSGIGMKLHAAGSAAVYYGSRQSRPHSVSLLALLLGACSTSVILHECGHLIAALLLRCEILGGSLGPLRAMRLRGRWRFQISGSQALRASVIAAPQKEDRNWRSTAIAVTAAGPVITLFTGLLSAQIADQAGQFNLFLTMMAQLNLVLFVLCLVPIQLKNSSSDAKLLLDLLKNGREAEKIAACFQTMRQRAEAL